MHGKGRQSFLLKLISTERVVPQLMDKLQWKGNTAGGFRVKRCFGLLEHSPQVHFPFKFICNKIVPSKVGSFLFGSRDEEWF